MYGLPQAGRLANNLLVKRLAHHGYHPVEHTPGMWRHKMRPITFTLVVDDLSEVRRQGARQPPLARPQTTI
jgi:hypothetical protein